MTWPAGGFVVVGFAACARVNTGIRKIATDKTGILTMVTPMSGINFIIFFSFFLNGELVFASNAGHQARREAEAQRKLYAVACMPWLAGSHGGERDPFLTQELPQRHSRRELGCPHPS